MKTKFKIAEKVFIIDPDCSRSIACVKITAVHIYVNEVIYNVDLCGDDDFPEKNVYTLEEAIDLLHKLFSN